MSGRWGSYLTATRPDEITPPATAAKPLAASAKAVLASLQRARTEQVNKESAARLAKQKADKAAADAKGSQDAAVVALTDSRRKFAEQREEVDRLAVERDAAQARLQQARLVAWTAAGGQGAPAGGTWDPGSGPGSGRRWDGWDPTLPQIPSANIPGDPIAV